MNYWSVRIVGIALLMLGVLRGHAQMHAFELKDGRVLEAEVVSYNSKIGQVALKRQDGKSVKVKADIFVEENQDYIRAWATAHAFLLDNILRVENDDRVVKKWKQEETREIRYTSGSIEKDFIHNVIKYENVAYDFTFNNMAETPIEGLHLEYCLYYEQSTMVWEEKPVFEKKTLCGRLDVPVLRRRVEVNVTTKPVMIYEDDINPVPQFNGDQRRPGKGTLIGMRARLVMKNSDENLVREFCDPSSLSLEKYPWTRESSPNKRKAYHRRRKK